jgi:hypothetical protein
MKPLAVIADMDGTLCDVREAERYVETGGWDAFHRACVKCPPHQMALDWCVDYHRRGHTILIVTGRDEWAREMTEEWLATHLPVPYAGPFMRADDDHRANVDVKRDIYHRELRGRFDIRAAIEDDPVITELWMGLGIPVTEVPDSDPQIW